MQVVPVEYILAKEEKRKENIEGNENFFFLTLNVSVTRMRIMTGFNKYYPRTHDYNAYLLI